MNAPALDPLDAFIEDLGLAIEEDGLPRIAGRILGLLIVEEGPFRFDEIAERLQVSRGSVSTNTRMLEQRGLLERYTLPGERRDLFRLCDDLYGRLLERSLERLYRRQAIIERCRAGVRDEQPFAAARLGEMSRFYRLAIENNQNIIERWRAGDVPAAPDALSGIPGPVKARTASTG